MQDPIYFVTTCTYLRKPVLANNEVAAILIEEWQGARDRHGCAIGRDVIMPDHVHFIERLNRTPGSFPHYGFLERMDEQRNQTVACSSKPCLAGGILRSHSSLVRKLQPEVDYVRQNPVRVGLVGNADDWPWQGQIEELRL